MVSTSGTSTVRAGPKRGWQRDAPLGSAPCRARDRRSPRRLPFGHMRDILFPMKPLLRELKNALFIATGILSAGMGLHGFLLSSRFIDGGVTGVSMLLAKVLGLPLSALILVINLPFIALGYHQIGRDFAIRSAAAIIGLSACLATIHYPDVTPDKLLTAVFGGFFIGAGMGLAMRGGAVLDGTDIAALLITKRSHLFRVGDVILGLNIVIFLTAAFFLGVDSALYSILTYVAASKTLDFLLHGIEEYTAITIVSERSDAIRQAITGVLAGGDGLQGARRDDRRGPGHPLLCRDAAGDRQGHGHRPKDRPVGVHRCPPPGRRQRGRPQEDRPPLSERAMRHDRRMKGCRAGRSRPPRKPRLRQIIVNMLCRVGLCHLVRRYAWLISSVERY